MIFGQYVNPIIVSVSSLLHSNNAIITNDIFVQRLNFSYNSTYRSMSKDKSHGTAECRRFYFIFSISVNGIFIHEIFMLHAYFVPFMS